MATTWGAGVSKYGALTGWALNTTDNPSESQRETAHDDTNNVLASELYDKRITINETFRAVLRPGGPTVPPNIGLHDGVPLTGINISTTRSDFATMTLTGHEHEDGTDGGSGDLREAAHGISMDQSFGVNLFGFTVSSATESTCNIECEHAEVPDADGDTAAGENHNASITVTITSHEEYATSVPEGFDIVAQRPGTDAQGFKTYITEAVKNVEFGALPAGGS